MPLTIRPTQAPAPTTKVPPTSGWLLLALVLTGLLLASHWLEQLPEAAPPAAATRPVPSARPATPPAAPGATYVTLGYSPTEIALLSTSQSNAAAVLLSQ